MGVARAFSLMVLFDCLPLIYLNAGDSIEYIDLTSLIIELIVAAISLYAVIKLFKNKGDGPVSVSDKIIRVIMVIILVVMSLVVFSVFASSHNVPISTELMYLCLFGLTFLATAYCLREK